MSSLKASLKSYNKEKDVRDARVTFQRRSSNVQSKRRDDNSATAFFKTLPIAPNRKLATVGD